MQLFFQHNRLWLPRIWGSTWMQCLMTMPRWRTLLGIQWNQSFVIICLRYFLIWTDDKQKGFRADNRTVLIVGEVWNRIGALIPDITPPHPVLTSVPNSSVKDFWLPLDAFDFSAKSKNGCTLAHYFFGAAFPKETSWNTFERNNGPYLMVTHDVNVMMALCDVGVRIKHCCLASLSNFPNNSQCSLFFREFAQNGYKSAHDAIVTKFPYGDGSRNLEPYSVGISDGFTKVILMFSIIGFAAELDLSEAEVKELAPTFNSFKWIRCTYEHFGNPGHHFLNSLSILAVIFLFPWWWGLLNVTDFSPLPTRFQSQ